MPSSSSVRRRAAEKNPIDISHAPILKIDPNFPQVGEKLEGKTAIVTGGAQFGVIAMTRDVAVYLAPSGIRVKSIGSSGHPVDSTGKLGEASQRERSYQLPVHGLSVHILS